MRALVLTYVELRNVSLRDLFRTAYMAAFQKDIPSGSLDEDVRTFNNCGNTPPYVVKFFLRLYGKGDTS